MNTNVSIAVETSCRAGGLALGIDARCVETVRFDTAGRHATALVGRMKALLDGRSLAPADLHEVYVSAGPGSFTGLRVGITAVRTLAQAVGRIRCVAVPTARVVAENAAELDWRYLGVILAARAGSVYAAVFQRRGGRIVPAAGPGTQQADEFLAQAPRPIMLIGEGLAYQAMGAPGVTASDPAADELHLPAPQALWRVGHDMARAGMFTDYHHLLPIYPRQCEAVRQWEARARRQDPQGP